MILFFCEVYCTLKEVFSGKYFYVFSSKKSAEKIIFWVKYSIVLSWRGRNEVIETSGRLHPLWAQNKRLRTPWTTDWIHYRQDRWIQTELAFTLAKNATKPNPFEIIALQTTRKENNWKTEETLARAVVTLETKRIKESNPWCLWWWWWWCLIIWRSWYDVHFVPKKFQTMPFYYLSRSENKETKKKTSFKEVYNKIVR